MKNQPQEHYTPYQLKLPVEIEKIIEISDPVYSFCEVMNHVDLGGLIGTFSEKINNETASDILNVIGLLSSISSKIFAVDFNKCEELLCEIFNKKKCWF